jgi:hypothetical protein
MMLGNDERQTCSPKTEICQEPGLDVGDF